MRDKPSYMMTPDELEAHLASKQADEAAAARQRIADCRHYDVARRQDQHVQVRCGFDFRLTCLLRFLRFEWQARERLWVLPSRHRPTEARVLKRIAIERPLLTMTPELTELAASVDHPEQFGYAISPRAVHCQLATATHGHFMAVYGKHEGADEVWEWLCGRHPTQIEQAR